MVDVQPALRPRRRRERPCKVSRHTGGDRYESGTEHPPSWPQRATKEGEAGLPAGPWQGITSANWDVYACLTRWPRDLDHEVVGTAELVGRRLQSIRINHDLTLATPRAGSPGVVDGCGYPGHLDLAVLQHGGAVPSRAGPW